MKKIILSLVLLAMLACTDQNTPTVVIKDGTLPGEFSVSATTKVHFSQGNWIEAKVKCVCTDYEGGTSTNKSTITRKITYWE